MCIEIHGSTHIHVYMCVDIAYICQRHITYNDIEKLYTLHTRILRNSDHGSTHIHVYMCINIVYI